MCITLAQIPEQHENNEDGEAFSCNISYSFEELRFIIGYC